MAAHNDSSAIEVGMRFRSSQAGQITGVRFYKGSGNTGTHTGNLWSASGARLATGTFTNETATGWQELRFGTPVRIEANRTYVASYHTPTGRYAAEVGGLKARTTNGPLTALADGEDGPSGVFRYGGSAFPTSTYQSTNYFVDVTFVADNPAPTGATILGNRTPKVASHSEANAIELGAKFRSTQPGTVTGVRFYKGSGNTGTHTGSLWSASGTRLATGTFTNETPTGWQELRFATPVRINANTVYVVSYHTPTGRYAADVGGLKTRQTSGPLQMLGDGESGTNGVFRYGTSGFPTSSYQATNYWVDVRFEADAPTTTTTTKPTTTTTKPTTTTTKPPTPTTPPVTGEVPCALTYEAKDCWAEHTGVPGYTSDQIRAGQSPLRKTTGVYVVDKDNTVVDGLWLEGCLAVRANNVTIKNTYIRGVNVNNWECTGGNRQAGPSALNVGNGNGGSGSVTGLKIIDTEIDGGNVSGYTAGVAASNYSCTRCEVKGFTIQMWATANVTITDSFVHDNNLYNQGNHADGIDSDSGTNVVLRHNWVGMDGGKDGTTASINFGGSWGPGSNQTLERNFLAGFGGSNLHISPDGRNVRIVDNAFSNRNGWGGTAFITGGIPAGSTVSGNYIPETGAALRL